jgi:hypothetical protein
VRSGDQLAAAEIVQQYEPEFRREVRVRLHDPRLRRVLDSMDISQSVLGSFAVRVASGQSELNRPYAPCQFTLFPLSPMRYFLRLRVKPNAQPAQIAVTAITSVEGSGTLPLETNSSWEIP